MDTSRLNAFITRIGADGAPDSPAAPFPAPTPGRPRGRGPLAGLSFATKDLIATAGIRTTAGSAILKDWVPTRSAPIVRALVAAGAFNVGKTNTHEFAFGTTNDNPHFGPTHNPWDTALTTGGSSGGSAAAVSAGMVPLALGTDTAGSIRIPAALCGCVGFKPGWGVLSTRGVVPLAPTLDTVGFLSATVEDAARAFAAVRKGADRPAKPPRSLRGLRIGIVEEHCFERVEDEIVAAVLEALKLLERQGARLLSIGTDAFDDVQGVGVPIVRAEAITYHAQWFPSRRGDYGADVAASLDAALLVTDAEYHAALDRRRAIARTARFLFEEVDLLAGPTVPITAFPNRYAYQPVAPGRELPRYALTRLTYLHSLARLPAITVPCGLSSRRLPIGLQLAADAGHEASLLAVAGAYETARGPLPRPPIHLLS
jgi:aspartyl-tRNA(Asn)/glutamyl-tRNA(Gln) amidotransferase subunit A